MRIVLVILLALFSNNPKEIAKINALKKEAEKAYLAGDYELALSKYAILSDSLGIDEDEIKLNLAHSHFHLGDTTGAKSNYNQLARSTNNKLKSIAYQQLGVMSKDSNKLEEALQQLKSAIKADPTNQGARYDYEVVKKMLKEQQEQEKQDQKQDEQNKDGEDENEQKNDEKKEGEEENEEKKEGESEEKSDEQKEQEQKEGEQKEGEEKEPKEKSKEQMTKEKLEEMNISEEKARMLLEAMRQNEIKYLQQQKRKATERPPSGKPDW
jgi:Ca-activated chloride channel homolog